MALVIDPSSSSNVGLTDTSHLDGSSAKTALRPQGFAGRERTRLVRDAEAMALRSSKRKAFREAGAFDKLIKRRETEALAATKAAGAGERFSHPYPNSDVHDELKILKHLAAGSDLSVEHLNMLAAMSIRHHETTLRF